MTNESRVAGFTRDSEEETMTQAAKSATEATATTILALERGALDRWGRGDPDGFLEISDPDVMYFDPFVPGRLDGRPALEELYATLRGKIHIDHYEMINPKVQVFGETAVLTFNFVSHRSEGAMHWNTTEVYRRRDGQWRIVHTHWSLTQAGAAKPGGQP